MKRLLLVLLAVACASAVAASTATAQGTDAERRVADGFTRLQVDPDTATALRSLGVSVRPSGSAVASGATFTFRITGGKVSTDPLGGKVRHSGGLVFASDDARLGVRDFVVNLDRGVLVARVAGTDSRVPLLNLAGGEAEVRGSLVRLTDVRATLTPQGAAALNDTFSTDAFEAGLGIGDVKTVASLGR